MKDGQGSSCRDDTVFLSNVLTQDPCPLFLQELLPVAHMGFSLEQSEG